LTENLDIEIQQFDGILSSKILSPHSFGLLDLIGCIGTQKQAVYQPIILFCKTQIKIGGQK
jgi:hypothetical protein